MGVFFRSAKPVLPAIQQTIADALRVSPNTVVDVDHDAADRTVKLAQSVAHEFNWGRFACALLISAALLLMAIWTGKHDLPDVSKSLMTSFQAYSGLVVGLLGGEAQNARSVL